VGGNVVGDGAWNDEDDGEQKGGRAVKPCQHQNDHDLGVRKWVLTR
jgi:hypothetical protein